jgi:hypothetical protein
MIKSQGLAIAQSAIEGCTVLLGRLVRCENGVAWVSHAGAPCPVACDVLHGIDVMLLQGGADGARVLVAVPSDGSAPLIVGIVAPERMTARPKVGVEETGACPPEVVVDGERLVFEARRELVLRCGQSEIVLRRDGNVVVRGRDVTTRASHTNKIKGANVNIN